MTNETMLSMKALPEYLFKRIRTENVRVKEIDGGFYLTPMEEKFDSTFGLRGMFAGYDDMTVDKFLERKRQDEELER